MLEVLKQPWPWYMAGITITLVMAALLYFGKSFGFSSNLRTICSIAGAGKRVDFFNYDWKAEKWNLLFLIGSIVGGFIAANWLNDGSEFVLSLKTVADLKEIGIRFDGQMNPEDIFGWNFISTGKGFLILLAGGILVGFGTRYAGGCSSGHAISGLSNLQLPSLIAVVGFFAGGLVMTHFLLPFIF
ncbi:MAG: YeeE/YedE thiosulfate transporter family protein [Bacteroidota bacterium]